MGEPHKFRARPGLVAARKRLGLTQETAADQVGVSPTTWARWERGEQDIRPHSRAQIAGALGSTLIEVERWIEGEDADPLPWIFGGRDDVSLAATVDNASELWGWDVNAARRRVLAVLPFVPGFLSEWLLSWSLDPPYESRSHSGPGPAVGMEDVRRIHEATQAFTSADHQFGGGLIRPAVLDYLNSKVAPLLRGTYSDDVGAALMTAASWMTELAGWEAYDVGMQGLAQVHFGQALKLAKAGGDELAGAYVLSVLAQQAIDLKHPSSAVRLARAACQSAEKAQGPPRVRAMLLVREARATALGVDLAEVHDAHAAARVRRLLGAAEQMYARAGTGDDDPVWIADIGRAEFTAEMGCCWRMIKEHGRAANCAEQAIRGFGQHFPRSVQFNRVHAAEALVAAGELEQALDSARAAVPMANALTSARSVELIKGFDARLSPYSTEPQVREWREFLRHGLHAVS